jgi:hypothetical protein
MISVLGKSFSSDPIYLIEGKITHISKARHNTRPSSKSGDIGNI